MASDTVTVSCHMLKELHDPTDIIWQSLVSNAHEYQLLLVHVHMTGKQLVSGLYHIHSSS